MTITSATLIINLLIILLIFVDLTSSFSSGAPLEVPGADVRRVPRSPPASHQDQDGQRRAGAQPPQRQDPQAPDDPAASGPANSRRGLQRRRNAGRDGHAHRLQRADGWVGGSANRHPPVSRLPGRLLPPHCRRSDLRLPVLTAACEG